MRREHYLFFVLVVPVLYSGCQKEDNIENNNEKQKVQILNNLSAKIEKEGVFSYDLKSANSLFRISVDYMPSKQVIYCYGQQNVCREYSGWQIGADVYIMEGHSWILFTSVDNIGHCMTPDEYIGSSAMPVSVGETRYFAVIVYENKPGSKTRHYLANGILAVDI